MRSSRDECDNDSDMGGLDGGGDGDKEDNGEDDEHNKETMMIKKATKTTVFNMSINTRIMIMRNIDMPSVWIRR